MMIVVIVISFCYYHSGQVHCIETVRPSVYAHLFFTRRRRGKGGKKERREGDLKRKEGRGNVGDLKRKRGWVWVREGKREGAQRKQGSGSRKG